MPDPTEPHNGDSTEVLAPPAEVDDDDDLLAGDDPDLEGLDLDVPGELPPLPVDDALPDDAAIDHILAELPDDLEERLARLEAAVNGAAPAPPPAAGDERIERLEEAAKALAEAALKHDRGRVRRKVSAASLGAFVAAAIPVLLQLVGALDLSPELTSTISAAAALVGAFAAGWTTPERQPSVDAQAVQALVKAP